MTDGIVTVSIRVLCDKLRLTPIAYVILRCCTMYSVSDAILPGHRYDYKRLQYILAGFMKIDLRLITMAVRFLTISYDLSTDPDQP